MNRTILITGANGFLGKKLCERFTSDDYVVRALARSPEHSQDLTPVAQGGIFKCSLPDEIDPQAFQGDIEALVHCAYDTRFSNLDHAKRTNIEGSKNLFEIARRRKVKQIVFISSLAAHAQARSFYGQSKLAIEKSLSLNTSDAVVKPGTIIGRSGLFDRTRQMVAKTPILPLFYGSSKRLQTVWIDDVCEAVFKIVEGKKSGEFVVAEAPGTLMNVFYKAIGLLENKDALIAPFPGDIALLGLRLTESLGLKLPISSENLLGIKHIKEFPNEPAVTQLGTRIRPFSESMYELARLEGKDKELDQLKRFFRS